MRPQDDRSPYTFESLVASGGTADVWVGRGPFGEKVALKVLRGHLEGVSLEKEAVFGARLSHPHVVSPIYLGHLTSASEGCAVGSSYLVLPWQGGGVLHADRITNMRELAAVGVALSSALAHLHGRDLLHLDLKPENVLCGTQPPDWRLLDFGISRTRFSPGTRAAGTPAFVSPEQLDDPGSVGPWSDLYALGCVLFTLLTGHPPYVGSKDDVLRGHLLGDLPAIEPRFAVSSTLVELLKRLLLRDPLQRPYSAGRVAKSFAHLARLGRVPRHSRALAVAGDSIFVVNRHPTVALRALMEDPTVIGRSREQGVLRSDLALALGDSRPVHRVVCGVPGVGSSRLASWLAEHAVECGLARAGYCDGGDTKALVAMTQRLSAHQTMTGWVNTLRRCVDMSPTVLVIDGPLSDENRAHLLGIRGSLLIIELAPTAKPEHRVLSLQPLSTAAMVDLATHLLTCSSSSARRIAQKSGGRPLAMVRLITHLEKSGKLAIEAGVTHIDEVDIPEEWSEADYKKIVRLMPSCRKAISFLAAAHREVKESELAEAQIPAQQVRTLVGEGLVFSDQRGYFGWNNHWLHERLRPSANVEAWLPLLKKGKDSLLYAWALANAQRTPEAVRVLRKVEGKLFEVSADDQRALYWVLDEISREITFEATDRLMAGVERERHLEQLLMVRARGESCVPLLKAITEVTVGHGLSAVDAHLPPLWSDFAGIERPKRVAEMIDRWLEQPWSSERGYLSAVAARMDVGELLGDAVTVLERAAVTPLKTPGSRELVQIWWCRARANQGSVLQALEMLRNISQRSLPSLVSQRLMYEQGVVFGLAGHHDAAANALSRCAERVWRRGSSMWVWPVAHLALVYLRAGRLADGLHLLQRLGNHNQVRTAGDLKAMWLAWAIYGLVCAGQISRAEGMVSTEDLIHAGRHRSLVLEGIGRTLAILRGRSQRLSLCLGAAQLDLKELV